MSGNRKAVFSYDVDLSQTGSDETKPYYDMMSDDASLVPYYDGDIVFYGEKRRRQKKKDDRNDDDDDGTYYYKKRNVNEDYEKYLKKLLREANISFMDEKELSKSNFTDEIGGGDENSKVIVNKNDNKDDNNDTNADFYFSGEEMEKRTSNLVEVPKRIKKEKKEKKQRRKKKNKKQRRKKKKKSKKRKNKGKKNKKNKKMNKVERRLRKRNPQFQNYVALSGYDDDDDDDDDKDDDGEDDNDNGEEGGHNNNGYFSEKLGSSLDKGDDFIDYLDYDDINNNNNQQYSRLNSWDQELAPSRPISRKWRRSLPDDDDNTKAEKQKASSISDLNKRRRSLPDEIFEQKGDKTFKIRVSGNKLEEKTNENKKTTTNTKTTKKPLFDDGKWRPEGERIRACF